MKLKYILFIAISVLLAVILYFLIFRTKEDSTSKSYKNKAEQYEKTNQDLSDQSLSVDKEVKRKEAFYDEKIKAIDVQLIKLEQHKELNKKRIDSTKRLQEDILNEYCADMKELGQVNIERCKE